MTLSARGCVGGGRPPRRHPDPDDSARRALLISELGRIVCGYHPSSNRCVCGTVDRHAKIDMETNLKKLVSISCGALCDDAPQIPKRLLSQSEALGEQLIRAAQEKERLLCL